jgi:ubiquinone/menaquinone biosynthesis C-methylase UbiE
MVDIASATTTRRAEKLPFVEYYLGKYAIPRGRTLDVGCGTGQYRHSTGGTYIGIDLSAEPYKPGYPRDVDVVATGTLLPFANETFDLIFCVGAFFQFASPLQALSEFNRVLNRGGRVLIFDYNRRIQKYLEVAEVAQRPCWTQWQLRHLVRAAGFSDCEMLLPFAYHVTSFARSLLVLGNEFLGRWAIVVARK